MCLVFLGLSSDFLVLLNPHLIHATNPLANVVEFNNVNNDNMALNIGTNAMPLGVGGGIVDGNMHKLIQFNNLIQQQQGIFN